MPRIQMSIKPSYNMTPNQRKMVAQRRNVDTEVVSKSGKKLYAFLFVGFGVIAIAAVAGFFMMNNNPEKQPAKDMTASSLTNEKPETSNVSQNEINPLPDSPNETPDNSDIVNPAKEINNTEPEEVYVPKKITFDSINPNTKFAQNFFDSLDYIVPDIPKALKSDILSNWAADAAKFSSNWRDFSNNAKTNARWGISRKASEIADDWGYLAEFFTKDVTPDDREHLRNIVSDIISRETVLKKQCEN